MSLGDFPNPSDSSWLMLSYPYAGFILAEFFSSSASLTADSFDCGIIVSDMSKVECAPVPFMPIRRKMAAKLRISVRKKSNSSLFLFNLSIPATIFLQLGMNRDGGA